MDLTYLTDKQLSNDIVNLASREREIIEEILWHLQEIDKRKLYSDFKCGSLYEYCVKVLKYSEGEASRRVRACRLLSEIPELSDEIKTGSLNLTKLNIAKSFFDENKISNLETKKEILTKLKNKSTRQSEQILWELKNGEAPRKVQVTILEETLEELNKLKVLKAHSCKNLDSLLQKMSKDILLVWDPSIVKKNKVILSSNKRYIPRNLKAELWKKYQGKCSICSSHFALQIDHIKPFSIGGETSIDNLRLLCRNCNQRQGIKFFQKSSSSSFSSTS